MSDLDDLSDPSGAGRGDRRKARQLVDAAYAGGRISAADRTLRVERIDAAATRGDLAMVVRDLAVRPADPTPSFPSSPPAPTVGAGQEPFPTPADDQTPDARPWPPPGYAGDASAPTPPSRASRRTIGCIVAAVAFFFLFPFIIGLALLVLGLAVGGPSDDSGPDITPAPSTSTPF